MALPQRIYPVGEQSFEKVREKNCIYVDKTELIYNLTHGSTDYVFLSRPRRFGKSLLISTMKEYFLGRKELFKGLAMEKLETEWTEYVVFHVDFSQLKYSNVEQLQVYLDNTLTQWETIYGKVETERTFSLRFAGVVRRAVAQTGRKAVVLIDEYDAPLLDTNSNPELQKQLRNISRDFFSPLKNLNDCLRFLILTGITKFSQLSIFSELNNLANISLEDEYAAICGITKEELLTQMCPDIEQMAEANNETFDEACEHLRMMYDGYHFSKKSPNVYNPFSLVRAFNSKEYNSYWFESGTPTFLIDVLKKTNFDLMKLEGLSASASEFDRPAESVNNPIAVLYQSGYLTIKGYDKEIDEYILQFPNNEVRYGFLEALLPNYIDDEILDKSGFTANSFIKDLRVGDVVGCMERLKTFLASIPYTLNNKTEKHFQTIFYVLLTLMGQRVRVEECFAAGRADIVMWIRDFIFVFELKIDGSAEEALAQIDSKGYAIPFSADGRKVYKIGANISSQMRTLTDWKIVEA